VAVEDGGEENGTATWAVEEEHAAATCSSAWQRPAFVRISWNRTTRQCRMCRRMVASCSMATGWSAMTVAGCSR
jgi:hypothetical protein